MDYIDYRILEIYGIKRINNITNEEKEFGLSIIKEINAKYEVFNAYLYGEFAYGYGGNIYNLSITFDVVNEKLYEIQEYLDWLQSSIQKTT